MFNCESSVSRLHYKWRSFCKQHCEFIRFFPSCFWISGR